MSATPGPWTVVNHQYINTTDGEPIADISPNPAWEANARLIAAAPDLLEALVMAVAVLERFREELDFPNIYTADFRAAIAKATGEDGT